MRISACATYMKGQGMEPSLLIKEDKVNI